MDTPSIIGSALAFSVIALPIILILYNKGILKDIQLLEGRLRLDFEKEITGIKEVVKEGVKDQVAEMLSSFKKDLNLNHRKLSVENLDKISDRLIKIADWGFQRDHASKSHRFIISCIYATQEYMKMELKKSLG